VAASYEEIGVVIARSARADFATAVVGAGVQSAAATTACGTRVESTELSTVERTVAAPDAALTPEPLSAVVGHAGDPRRRGPLGHHRQPDVVVGVLDTGVEHTHPDLA
jgi:hypothetical protein